MDRSVQALEEAGGKVMAGMLRRALDSTHKDEWVRATWKLLNDDSRVQPLPTELRKLATHTSDRRIRSGSGFLRRWCS